MIFLKFSFHCTYLKSNLRCTYIKLDKVKKEKNKAIKNTDRTHKHLIRPEKPVKNKLSSLLGLLVSYKEKELL
jgi:hypothetical protein